MKHIAILGCTGSIGCSTLQIIRQNPDLFKVKCLIAGNNANLLLQQAQEFLPDIVAIDNNNNIEMLKQYLPTSCKLFAGSHEVLLALQQSYDLVISAAVGIAGLLPTITAIKAGNNIALANKESLVCGGDLINQLAKKHNVSILPIDSEHNALWQIINSCGIENIDSIVLTASGGPFFNFTGDIKTITVNEALKHPKWQMGAKISIDSATMMNKGLEVIEAYYLFTGIKSDQIKVLIHPQSIVHGLVNYCDGSSFAMLSEPDMKISIGSALNFPHRLTNQNKLCLKQITKLEFFDVDLNKFPAFKLCQQALQNKGSSLTTLNASNEVAVEAFLQQKIAFWQIPAIIEETLSRANFPSPSCFEEIININQLAKNIAQQLVANI
jgi:1-deoxy-D-xylulose-5-phosphate reductoisomerase